MCCLSIGALPAPAGQLPPVPGYIPVYIQSGDSPPDVQRLYESHRTLAAHAHAHANAPAAAPSRRTAQVVEAPAGAAPDSDAPAQGIRHRPAAPQQQQQQNEEPRQPLRSRLPAAAPAAPAATPSR